MLTWYALRSKPNKEPLLSEQLDAQGIEYYYPQLRVKPVNPRARKIRAYFPGYLFVHLDIDQLGENALQYTPYSLGIVSFDGIPAPVPDALVNAIHYKVDRINAKGGEQIAGIKPGDDVTVSDGPFSGYEAVLDASLPSSQRVVILLKLLKGKSMKVELPAAQVKPSKKH